MEAVSLYLEEAGKFLHSISAVATSQGKIPHEKVWYLTPEQHVLEILICNIVFGGLLFLTLRNRVRNEPAVASATTKSSSPSTFNLPKDDIQVLGFIPKVLRFILTVCFCVTAYHKYAGDKLALMMMPCHTVTLCYLASLYSKKHSTAEFIFNVAVHYMFFTWLALLLPDKKGLTQYGEIPNFWIHHWVLFIIPIDLISTFHYRIHHTGHYHFKIAAATGALLHFDVMSIAGIISGHNVGYMLAPPPKTVFTGTFFRWGHAMFLIVMGWFSGYIVPWIIIRVRETVVYIFKMKKND